MQDRTGLRIVLVDLGMQTGLGRGLARVQRFTLRVIAILPSARRAEKLPLVAGTRPI